MVDELPVSRGVDWLLLELLVTLSYGGSSRRPPIFAQSESQLVLNQVVLHPTYLETTSSHM